MGIFSPSLNSHISILLLEIMTSYHLDKSLCDIRMFPSLKRQAPWTVEILPLTHICTPQKRAFQLVCHKRVMTTPKILILFFNLFNWRLITLQYYSGFLPYIDMNQPWVYMCSLSWTSLPPPSPSHPSGSTQCTSPEHPVPILILSSPSEKYAKPLQSCPTLCDPIDSSPPSSPVPGILGMPRT